MMDYAKSYGIMHGMADGKYFSGYSLRRCADQVGELVELTKPRQLLDYGSGKGYQYMERRVHERWGGMLPYLYDIGVRQLAARPSGKFDGIICTDVMEHIEECDVAAVLEDIFSFVSVRGEQEQSFVFFWISCLTSHKLLPDGRNVHLTIKPPEWWCARLERFNRHGLIVRSRYDGPAA